MDVEIPPARDSPKHILNALNDDCIQLVLRRLDNIRDLQSAAETCIRFQENAKLLYRTNFKSVRIAKQNNNATNDKNTVVDRPNEFLSIFGHLITELDFDGAIDDEIIKVIADYCGKTLRVLKCGDKYSRKCSAVNFKTRSRLQALEELEIRNIEVKNFKYYSQLKKLTAKSDAFKWLQKPFPKLEFVQLISVEYLVFSQVAKFFKLNPQLEGLAIDFRRHLKYMSKSSYKCCIQIPLDIAKPIYKSIKNQKRMELRTSLLKHISNLRNLKSLAFDPYCGYSKNLIDSFIENNVPIENLIHRIYSDRYDLNFLKLDQLKKLYLLSGYSYSSDMVEETLINSVKNLPKLEEILFTCDYITINGIKAALEYGEHLSILAVVIDDDITVDLDDYTSLWILAESRGVKVEIYAQNGIIDVPTDLIQLNQKWLNIVNDELSYFEIKRRFIE